MNIDAEELLARIKRDYPTPYELSQLRLVIDKQQDTINALQAELDDLQQQLEQRSGDATDPSTDGDYDTAGLHVAGADTTVGEPLSLRLRTGNPDN